MKEERSTNEDFPLYSQDGIIVRRSNQFDINDMADRLRESDVKEIWYSHHETPRQALYKCVNQSIWSATIENGRPIGIFGVTPSDKLLGYKGTVFMLATNDLDKISRRFVRNSRKMVDYMLEFYPILENYVHNMNIKSITWLEWLGAKIYPARPYGLDNQLFRYFTFKKEK